MFMVKIKADGLYFFICFLYIYDMGKKRKKYKKPDTRDYIKIQKMLSREEELLQHGKLISLRLDSVHVSKKIYNRKHIKNLYNYAED